VSILGKGGKVRQVLLPEIVSRAVLSLRGGAGDNDPVFPSRTGGGKLTERNVNAMVKRTAAKAGRPWLPCDRSRCFAAEGPVDPGPRQHRHHVRLSACPTQYIEQPARGSGSVSSIAGEGNTPSARMSPLPRCPLQSDSRQMVDGAIDPFKVTLKKRALKMK
jgi:hypothetical protein